MEFNDEQNDLWGSYSIINSTEIYIATSGINLLETLYYDNNDDDNYDDDDASNKYLLLT